MFFQNCMKATVTYTYRNPYVLWPKKMKLCFLQLFRSMTGVVDPITGGSRSAGGGDQGAWGCPQNDWRLPFGSLA